MRVCRNMAPLPRETFANSQRRHGRIHCHQITCSLGEVLDLSAGGMRVLCRGSMGLRDGQTVGLTLAAGGAPIPLPCQIVWMRKTGWRIWEMGLRLLDLSPSSRQSLSGIARTVTFQNELSTVAPDGSAR